MSPDWRASFRVFEVTVIAASFASRLLCAPAPEPAASPSAMELVSRIAENKKHGTDPTRGGSVTVTIRTEELDKKGKVESATEIVMKQSHENGKDQSELVRFVRDGKDVTAEEKKKQAEAEAKAAKEKPQPKREEKRKDEGESNSLTLSLSDPFEPKMQGKYRFTIAGRETTDPAKVRIRFEPKGDASPDLNIGEALVDPATGAIYRVAYRPSKNPRFVDRLDVAMEFTPQSEAGPNPTKISFDGEGGFLFIHKHIRSTTTFSDWKRGAAPAAPPATGQ